MGVTLATTGSSSGTPTRRRMRWFFFVEYIW
jgi:hypothetical protein